PLFVLVSFPTRRSSDLEFVASFIGSPAMNLHEVTYSQGRITGSGIDLAVSEPSRKVLDEKGYEGKTVVFGIRPEDIHSEQIEYLDRKSTRLNSSHVSIS